MRFSIPRMFKKPILIVILAFCAGTAGAQSTNLSLFQDLAVECLGDLPQEVRDVVLTAPGEMPYVRSALVSAWQSSGHEIFIEDDEDDTPGQRARVMFAVEDARVVYTRSSSRLSRNVDLSLRYSISSSDGRILVDDRCAERRSDVIAWGDVDAVEHETYPETQGVLPPAGRFRRLIEPAVVTAATAVAVFLFFTLRSAGGDGS